MDASAMTPRLENNSADFVATTFEAQRQELAGLIDRHCPQEGKVETVIPGLLLFRGCRTDKPSCTVITSAFAMMAQGAKRVLVGDEAYEYDPGHYMIASVELPTFSCLTMASTSEPYLGLALAIDPLKIAELAATLPARLPANMIDRGIGVGAISLEIQNAALRLTRLLDTPEHIPVLAPIIERELLYRLLTGALGAQLHQAVTTGSHSQQIVRTLDWLKSNLDQAVSIDHLADLANMSKSSLHHHFKVLTAMTPLQYQKQLRLQEARRLMLADHDAASAAHRVGYESPSQFSREYRRLFGAPPARDIAQLRAASDI